MQWGIHQKVDAYTLAGGSYRACVLLEGSGVVVPRNVDLVACWLSSHPPEEIVQVLEPLIGSISSMYKNVRRLDNKLLMLIMSIGDSC